MICADASETTAFSFHYEGDLRIMTVEAIGDPWTAADVEGWAADALAGCEWVLVGGLLRSHFEAAAADALAAGGRRLLLDAQGVTRVAELGPLREDAAFDRGLLRDLAVLKLNEEEGLMLAGGLELERLEALGVPEVVLTLGSQGAEVLAGGELTPVAARAGSGRGRPDRRRRRVLPRLRRRPGERARSGGRGRARGARRHRADHRPVTPLLVACALGTVAVDLDEEEDAEVVDDALPATDPPAVDLPLLVAAAAHGSTVVAVVDRRPPLVVSNDGGRTWREAGAGLGRAVAVAISPVHPDLVAFATEERIHVSRDGGRFWSALAVELPAITAIAFPPVAV